MSDYKEKQTAQKRKELADGLDALGNAAEGLKRCLLDPGAAPLVKDASLLMVERQLEHVATLRAAYDLSLK